MPINNPNGNEVSEIVLPNGNTASKVIAPDGSTVANFGPPDSTIDRGSDDGSSSQSVSEGVKINPNTDFGAIGAKISANTSGLTQARVYDLSDNSLLNTNDISSLSAGDSFVIEADFVTGNDYSLVADAEGSSYTSGYVNNTASNSYTSSDFDIPSSISNDTESGNAYSNLNPIGNV
jgi:hypothetical protein